MFYRLIGMCRPKVTQRVFIFYRSTIISHTKWVLVSTGRTFRVVKQESIKIVANAYLSPVWRSVTCVWSRYHDRILPFPLLSCHILMKFRGPREDSTLSMKFNMLPLSKTCVNIWNKILANFWPYIMRVRYTIYSLYIIRFETSICIGQ